MVIDHAIRELHSATQAIHRQPYMSARDAELVFQDMCLLLSVIGRTAGKYDDDMLDSARLILMLLKERAKVAA